MCNEVEASPLSAGEAYSAVQANGRMGAMIMFLSRELSRARILPDNGRCCRCPDYGFETCARCWREIAAKEAGEERIFR